MMRLAILFTILQAALSAREIPLFFFRGDHSIQTRTPRMTAEFKRGGYRISNGIRIEFLGSNASPEPDGLMAGTASFILGDDPARWRTRVPLYDQVIYKKVYPGIDAVYSGSDRRLKSDFIVAAGADPARIRLRYAGADTVFVDAQGGLVVRSDAGELREEPPVAWQEIGDRKVPVPVAFRVSGDVVTFELGPYDRARTLLIDPVVTYSSFLGGNRIDAMTGIAADSAGNAYVCGYTDSIDLPLAASYDNSANGGVDAFVAKFNAAGTSLVYATYIGGNGDDRAFSIKVDIWGNAHLTGWTGSTNYPKQVPLQSALSGTRDAFLTKLDVNGTGLLYSTYFGGSGSDSGNAIGLDQWENAYIAGETTSTNLPTAGLYGPAQPQNRGGQDAFVTKFSITGSLLFSTYLGGAGTDRATGVFVKNDTPYVTGSTTSVNFPVQGALQSASAGGQDAFVTRVSLYGNVFWYSTYLGGSAGATGFPESGYSIAVDGANNIYVAGVTSSSNFPLAAPFQTTFGGGGQDGFISKIASSGTSLVWSTFLGGTGIDSVRAIAVKTSGEVYAAGETASSNFPLGSPVQAAKSGSSDAFISKLNAAGSALLWSTYYGGNGADRAMGLDLAGTNVYVTGQTGSSNFPVVSAAQSFGLGEANGFVLKMSDTAGGGSTSLNATPEAGEVTPASSTASRQTLTAVVSDTNGFADVKQINFLVNSSASEDLFTCQVVYRRAEDRFYLLDDTNSPLGPAAHGASAILENTQCRLYARNSTAAGSGNTLTMHLDLLLQPGYQSGRRIFVAVEDAQGAKSAWVERAGWSVPGL
jgi:hypothetical protein